MPTSVFRYPTTSLLRMVRASKDCRGDFLAISIDPDWRIMRITRHLCSSYWWTVRMVFVKAD